MNMTYDSISTILTDVFESAFEDSGSYPTSFSDVGMSEIFPDDELDVAAYFDGPAFMKEYFNSSPVILEVKINGDEAQLIVFAGRSCSDPAMANEFIARYNDTTRFPGIWECCEPSRRNSELKLESRFEFDSEEEFRDELAQRLMLFGEDRFSNELRPFLHYFDN